MISAFISAGFDAWDVAVKDLLDGSVTLDEFRGIVFVGGFSFADGHSEIKKWTDPRTVVPPKYGTKIPLNVASPNNQDVLWMSQRSSSLRIQR